MDGSPENNGTQDSEDEDEDDPDSRRRAQVRKFATAESTVMPKLYRVSDASGSMTMTLEGEGQMTRGFLDVDDVFLLDAGMEVFVWIGTNATKEERRNGMMYAQEFIDENENRPDWIPVTRVMQDREPENFAERFFDFSEAYGSEYTERVRRKGQNVAAVRIQTRLRSALAKRVVKRKRKLVTARAHEQERRLREHVVKRLQRNTRAKQAKRRAVFEDAERKQRAQLEALLKEQARAKEEAERQREQYLASAACKIQRIWRGIASRRLFQVLLAAHNWKPTQLSELDPKLPRWFREWLAAKVRHRFERTRYRAAALVQSCWRRYRDETAHRLQVANSITIQVWFRYWNRRVSAVRAEINAARLAEASAAAVLLQTICRTRLVMRYLTASNVAKRIALQHEARLEEFEKRSLAAFDEEEKLAVHAALKDPVQAYNTFTERLMLALKRQFPALSAQERHTITDAAWSSGERLLPKAIWKSQRWAEEKSMNSWRMLIRRALARVFVWTHEDEARVAREARETAHRANVLAEQLILKEREDKQKVKNDKICQEAMTWYHENSSQIKVDVESERQFKRANLARLNAREEVRLAVKKAKRDAQGGVIHLLDAIQQGEAATEEAPPRCVPVSSARRAELVMGQVKSHITPRAASGQQQAQTRQDFTRTMEFGSNKLLRHGTYVRNIEEVSVRPAPSELFQCVLGQDDLAWPAGMLQGIVRGDDAGNLSARRAGTEHVRQEFQVRALLGQVAQHKTVEFHIPREQAVNVCHAAKMLAQSNQKELVKAKLTRLFSVFNDTIDKNAFNAALLSCDCHLSDQDLTTLFKCFHSSEEGKLRIHGFFARAKLVHRMLKSYLDADLDNSSAKNDGLLLPSIELTPGCATSTSTSSSTKDIRHKLRAVAHTNGGIDMAALFLSRFYERDDSAGVSFEEFRSVLRRDAKVTAAAVGDEELHTLYNCAKQDSGCSGEVPMQELLHFLQPDSKTSLEASVGVRLPALAKKQGSVRVAEACPAGPSAVIYSPRPPLQAKIARGSPRNITRVGLPRPSAAGTTNLRHQRRRHKRHKLPAWMKRTVRTHA